MSVQRCQRKLNWLEGVFAYGWRQPVDDGKKGLKGEVDSFRQAVTGNWIVRRLAPDCGKIELDGLKRQNDHARLIRAMGAETADVHLDSVGGKTLVKDLARRPASWLADAAIRMQGVVLNAWREWKSRSN